MKEVQGKENLPINKNILVLPLKGGGMPLQGQLCLCEHRGTVSFSHYGSACFNLAKQGQSSKASMLIYETQAINIVANSCNNMLR